MSKSHKYLDVLKVLEFGAEGGSEALYRLLPYGSASFIWRTYGNSIGEDDAGDEVWEGFSDEFEDISEYLIGRSGMLAGLGPLYIDPNFRDVIFKAFMQSLRDPVQNHAQWLFGELNSDGWRRWQTLLQLRASYDEIVVHSAFGNNPVRQVTFDYDSVKTVQEMLNAIYMSLLHSFMPAATYGRRWRLYDLVECRELSLPRDDREDPLYDAGIKQGGQWVVYGVG